MSGPAQAGEQIIAGVVLSERLAVTMYGAIHRAQFGGQRNLRGLVVDPKMLADDSFRLALTDAKNIASVTAFDHPNIVPTVGVEAGGAEVVVVTRGVGRYVTVQDLITAAKARGKHGGRLDFPIAALIGKSVIEALAVAHKAKVIHGAVHPRSVLVDEDGGVRLGDFVVGRALTIALAQGADSSLWRGLAGYIAPELVVGEDPTPGADVFAVGALLFAMLTGEVPPGPLRATPAVERLVQRALDTDVGRRYRSASDLLENLQEAMEDDRWDVAERRELIQEAGLTQADTNIDEATEDLLASLGEPSGIQLQPLRPSIDARAQAAAKKQKTQPGEKNRLDALLASIDGEETGVTQIDEPPSKFKRDPISDIIKKDPRRAEAIVSSARVPSLDDPDDGDFTPLPPPQRDSQHDFTQQAGGKRRSSPGVARTPSADEAAALSAIGDLDSGARRVNTAAEQAAAAAAKLEEAAARAERAARRAETGDPVPAQARRARPIVEPDPALDADIPTPRLKSPLRGVFGGVLLLAVLGGAGYVVYTKLHAQDADAERARVEKEKKDREAQELSDKLRQALPDPGKIEIDCDKAGVWLKLGRTPLDTKVYLPAGQAHDLVLLHDGDEMTEAQVNGTHWSGADKTLKAKITVTLKPQKPGAKPAELPLQPTSQVIPTTGVKGAGPVHVESTPTDSEVWLFLGVNHTSFETWAGRDYELAVVKPGFKTKHVEIQQEEWRDGGDASVPIDVAKKKAVIAKSVELEPDPTAKPKGK